MGFFDWIRGLLGGGSPAGAGGVPARAPGPPGTSRSAAGSAGSPAPASGAAVGPARAPSPPQRRTVTLDLDLARFAPLSSADMHRAADALQNRFGAAWFGRRDIIPPAEDPRTNLIDRGMVGEGLVLPAELARIHDIGRRMDEVRPLAGAAAARAKADAVADRAALKARKQAEAAERRRRHSEEVAQRRATDIVFLGRGVSSGLADRTADAARLAAARLPLLATPGDVAAALGVPVPRLRWLAFHSDVVKTGHYVRFEVPKKSGGVRRLAAPRPHLAAAQRWILRNVLDLVPKHAAAHGFVAGRSTLTNAAPHVGRAVVVNADLKDFFPTITFPRVRGTFRELGYSPAAATVLALLATEAPRRTITVDGAEFLAATGPRALPQGACTSPAISNLVVRRMDSRLTAISAKLGFVYTRYADDLTFSGGPGTESKIGYLLARLRHIAQDEGFAVNEAKTRVQRRNTAQSVTGLVVNDRPGVPRKTVRRIRAILHRARHEGLAAQNRERRPNFEAWLRGMIAYVAMARPEQGAELRQELDALRG